MDKKFNSILNYITLGDYSNVIKYTDQIINNYGKQIFHKKYEFSNQLPFQNNKIIKNFGPVSFVDVLDFIISGKLDSEFTNGVEISQKLKDYIK